MSIRDEILAADDLPQTPVEIPEWGMTVYVREMTGTERDQYEGYLLEVKDKEMSERMSGMRARLALYCTVDENGYRIFADSDLPALGNKSARALDRIVDVAASENALTSDAVEEIAGNSGASGSDDFTSE